MKILKKRGNSFAPLQERPFKLERDLQNLVEANLTELLDLKLVKSEFAIKQYRFDTLAFDVERKSFVIIEYKRNTNYSVVDQGISYLNTMLANKGEFHVEYSETFNIYLKREDVDWSQTRVIFVAPSFTSFQKQAVNFKDLPIELCEVKQFEDDTLYVNLLSKSAGAPTLQGLQSSNSGISENSESLSKITKELKPYTEEDLLKGKSEDIKELYDEFKNAILALNSDIVLDPKKHYISFKLKGNVVDIEVQNKALKIWLNMPVGELDDPKGLTRNINGLGSLGVGNYDLKVKNTDNLEYIMSLVKQVIKDKI